MHVTDILHLYLTLKDTNLLGLSNIFWLASMLIFWSSVIWQTFAKSGRIWWKFSIRLVTSDYVMIWPLLCNLFTILCHTSMTYTLACLWKEAELFPLRNCSVEHSTNKFTWYCSLKLIHSLIQWLIYDITYCIENCQHQAVPLGHLHWCVTK